MAAAAAENKLKGEATVHLANHTKQCDTMTSAMLWMSAVHPNAALLTTVGQPNDQTNK